MSELKKEQLTVKEVLLTGSKGFTVNRMLCIKVKGIF